MSDSVIPWTVAYQAPLSMGILQARILEWVAMPFSRGSSQLRDRSHRHCRSLPSKPPGKPKKTGVGSLPLLQGNFPTQESNPSTWQADSLPSKPPGKPKKTGVGSLSLLQGNFLIQESNQGLLHCRWFLYWLRYQGSP